MTVDLKAEEARLVQLRNEKNRLEKEIDILKIKYDDRQHLFDKQARDFQSSNRADTDKIAKQLLDNKLREEKWLKAQSEVNQMKAQLEQDLSKQKDLLLRKEVELDRLIEETKREKAELAQRLSAVKEASHGSRDSKNK